MKFDSLVVFLSKRNMSEVYNNLAHEKLTMKSLVKVRQNDDIFLRTEVDEDVITIDYYYDDKSFDHEKEIIFLKKFLKVAKFDKKNWSMDPVLSVCKFSFNYSELIFERSINFLTQFNIKKILLLI